MIELLLILVVIGFALFLFNRFAPIDGNVKQLVNYVVIFVLCVVVVLFILRLFGIYSGPQLHFN
jgi:hypothetical protein